MPTNNNVYITTSSSISCAGANNEELFDNICLGNTGIQQDNTYFHDSTPAIGHIHSCASFDENLILQCQNILDNSNLENFEDTLLIVGSSVGGMRRTEEIFLNTHSYKDIDSKLHNIGSITHILNQKFNFYDDIVFSTACTSSANALGYAHETLAKGIYKNALVVGVDSLSQTTVGGFLSLGVLSSNPCIPFDQNRDGMNVAEAIACVLVQTTPSKNCVQLCGVGYSSDAHHMTHPHPEGLGAQQAMQQALEKAKIKAEDIDYINAHGTGTKANDSAEANAINALFSQNKPYVSSTKSITGHTLGAAGAIEAIVCMKVIETSTVPANKALEIPEHQDLNFSTQQKSFDVQYVMSNSFAFGGNNCSLIFGKVL
ncbi:MAG: beta-ketoacyl synthase N-terminal-like domain-containing protein [Campylobacterota bacterium]|nr:beta-ketoacyl synthase N-terminal-like domain-containing protein [Campylobacterota bacterium]